MSYSCCLNCKEMVGSYQKYCRECEKKFKQDEKFWETASYEIYKEPKRSEHLEKDKIK